MSNIEIIDEKYVYLGAYPQNGTEKEPIKWRILKREDNVLTLIADQILASFMYDRYYSDYKNSAIRRYLLNKFVPNAFTVDELAMILTTDWDGVADKVWIPSAEDIRELPREERIRKVTPFAVSNGASSYPIYSKKQKYLEGNGWYWTRSPWRPPYNPHNEREVLYVEYNGAITGRVTVGHDIGIVPLIRIEIDRGEDAS